MEVSSSRRLLLALMAIFLLFAPVSALGATQVRSSAAPHVTTPSPVLSRDSSSAPSSSIATTSGTASSSNDAPAYLAATLDPTSQAGCYEEQAAGAGWHQVPCSSDPRPTPDMPASGAGVATVGSGTDFVAKDNGDPFLPGCPGSSYCTIIGTATGTITDVQGLTSEAGGANCGSMGASPGTPDCYDLQLNSNLFAPQSTSFTDNQNGYSHSEVQFVYSNSAGLYIQYWLLGYLNTYSSCPGTGIPGGTGWDPSGSDCVASSMTNTDMGSTPATSIGELSLSAQANFMGSGLDGVFFCIGTGPTAPCYSVTAPDSILNLGSNWHQSEFNVVGDGYSSEAIFNAGTSFVVNDVIGDQFGDATTDSCGSGGTTAETNNLFLGNCNAVTSGSGISFGEASVGFNISATASDVVVLTGGTASVNIEVGLTGGSAGLGGACCGFLPIGGLPGGVTGKYSGVGVFGLTGSPPITTTLTIDTSGCSCVGDYTLLLGFADGGAVQQTSVNLHIYDFTIQVTPLHETVLRGSQAIYAIGLTLVSGSSGFETPKVALSTSGLPSDSSASFLYSTITPGSFAPDYLYVSTAGPSSGSLGDFTFKVIGTDPSGGGSHSVTGHLGIYDFSVSASPGDVTVLRGGSAPYTVTLTLTPGSSTPPAIHLGATGLPAGSSLTLSSPTVIPTLAGATSTMTINTYTGAPGPTHLGDFPFLVVATDTAVVGGGTRQGAANLHVYDYAVTATPGSLTMLTTSSGANTYTVTINLFAGSTTVGLPKIALSVAGLPSGAIGAFSTTSGTGGFTSSLTITTASTPAGTYVLTVAGTDGRSQVGGARTVSPTLIVLTPAAAIPLVASTISGFQSSGALNSGQANSLTVKLNHAVSDLNSDKENVACNVLNAFVNEVNSLVATGVLTTAQANQLLSPPLGVEGIMAAIPC
ncbi:MAG: hypothetical protein OK474_10055 [Thaumarchaeota archaeon]|nr:hypothetical protein [Nitrososphaerota archaeon]